MNVPEELKYSRDHEWAELNKGEATIGITDYAQDSLGDVVYVELPEVGRELEEGEVFGVVESIKAVSDLCSPLAGMIIEVNEEIVDRTDLLNEDPYGDGWLIKVKYNEENESLMTSDEYQEFLEGLD